jgi:hypothetical protein
MFRFPLTQQPQTSREPFSLQTLAKTSRLRGATCRLAAEIGCPRFGSVRPHYHSWTPAVGFFWRRLLHNSLPQRAIAPITWWICGSPGAQLLRRLDFQLL